MSDKNKHKRKSPEDFIRYRSDKMTGKERNSFERKLQKDPFAGEAAEGFSSLSSNELEKDLAHLQKRLKTRTGRRQGFMYYRIAASVALLMIISTVFIIVEKNHPGKQLSEITVGSESDVVSEDSPAIKPSEKYDAPEKAVIRTEKKEETTMDNRTTGKESVQKSAPVEKEKAAVARNFDSPTEKISEVSDEFVRVEQIAAPAAAMARTKTSPELIVTGKVLSSEDSMPLPGASVSIKGARSAVATDTGYYPPQPLNGKPAFEKYIQENIHRPDSSTTGQRVVVVVSFLVKTNGSVDSIKIIRSPDRLFSGETIRLIKSGPPWKPAEDNGKIIEDDVRVKIVFK